MSSGRSRRGASRGHSLLTRAASWSTAPDGSVRSSEFTNAIEVLEDRSLLSAGDLDTTFDTDGIVTTQIGVGLDVGRDVAIQADGKIVVAGTTGSDFAVARYNVDGSLDTSFGSGGKVITDIGSSTSDEAYGVAIDSNGKIVVAGTSANEFAIVRYNIDGSLDTTFSGDGKVTTSIGNNAADVAIDANGKIVVAGNKQTFSATGVDFAVARFNTDGSLDTTFNGTGSALVDFGSNLGDSAQGIAIDSNGKVVAVG